MANVFGDGELAVLPAESGGVILIETTSNFGDPVTDCAWSADWWHIEEIMQAIAVSRGSFIPDLAICDGREDGNVEFLLCRRRMLPRGHGAGSKGRYRPQWVRRKQCRG